MALDKTKGSWYEIQGMRMLEGGEVEERDGPQTPIMYKNNLHSLLNSSPR